MFSDMRIIAESDPQIVETLENALICEFTVISQTGRPITHPLLPLYDADESRLYVTSSVLFSKKLDHIKKNPKVSALFSSREGLRVSPYRTVLVKGRAKICEEDVHHGWEKLLPLWRKKEPFIDNFVKMRYALPLFWDRSIIEIDPSKLYLWPHGDIDNPPKIFEVS